ncbi:hypothetical protein MVEN_01028900 [Mycena venus]|uniref:GATA-type domain-containing protein n=1 Tax=Mycena venus TaxID=2733690 RepID=A0A8H6YF89_9AGAR|nr:hypothetical protein MVEN_01028900 [Mycena venus]
MSSFRPSPELPILRAPIVNPYEKLTGPQFDAWINSMTGALRDARAYRAELPSKPKARTRWHIPAPHEQGASGTTEEENKLGGIRAFGDGDVYNGLQSGNGEMSGIDHWDKENADPISPLIRTPTVSGQFYPHPPAVERNDSKQGRKTGSESENEAGGSPARCLDISGDKNDELAGDPEFNELGLDAEEDLRAVEELLFEAEWPDQQAQDEDFGGLQLSNNAKEQDYQDKDILSGSSAIPSPSIEPQQHLFGPGNAYEVLDEPQRHLHQTNNQLKIVDWSHQPAFSHEVPEDDNVVDYDEYLQPEAFGLSDKFPKVRKPKSDADDQSGNPEEFQDVDAQSNSPGMLVDPHFFNLIESFADKDGGMRDREDRDVDELMASSTQSLDYADEMMCAEGEPTQDMRQEQAVVEEGSEDARQLSPYINGEVVSQKAVGEPGQQIGGEGSIPIFASPTVHDSFGSPQTMSRLPPRLDCMPLSVPPPVFALNATSKSQTADHNSEGLKGGVGSTEESAKPVEPTEAMDDSAEVYNWGVGDAEPQKQITVTEAVSTEISSSVTNEDSEATGISPEVGAPEASSASIPSTHYCAAIPECKNCHRTSTNCHWNFSRLKTDGRICQNCYTYEVKYQKPRPVELEVKRQRGRKTKTGPRVIYPGWDQVPESGPDSRWR